MQILSIYNKKIYKLQGTPYIFSQEFGYCCAAVDDPTSERAAMVSMLYNAA